MGALFLACRLEHEGHPAIKLLLKPVPTLDADAVAADPNEPAAAAAATQTVPQDTITSSCSTEFDGVDVPNCNVSFQAEFKSTLESIKVASLFDREISDFFLGLCDRSDEVMMPF